jgi:hypothetical protein
MRETAKAVHLGAGARAAPNQPIAADLTPQWATRQSEELSLKCPAHRHVGARGRGCRQGAIQRRWCGVKVWLDSPEPRSTPSCTAQPSVLWRRRDDQHRWTDIGRLRLGVETHPERHRPLMFVMGLLFPGRLQRATGRHQLARSRWLFRWRAA